jgi:hypothetical protein
VPFGKLRERLSVPARILEDEEPLHCEGADQNQRRRGRTREPADLAAER